MEPALQSQGIAARAITAELHDGYKNGGWLQVKTDESSKAEMTISVPEDGNYRVQLKPVNHLIKGAIQIGLKDGELKKIEKRDLSEHKIPYVNLGITKAVNKTLTVLLSGNAIIGIDHIKIEKIKD